MMTMRTQFGDMKITDDNQTITNDSLKKEIDDKILDGKKADILTTNEANKGMDK